MAVSDFPGAPGHAARVAPALFQVSIGYIRLRDAAPLIVAEALGLFRRHGLIATLVPERAWAALRDRLAVGVLDAAQLLSPLAVALAAEPGPRGAALSVPATLGRNGNVLVLAAALAADPAGSLRRLGRRPRIAVVHAYSSHAYHVRAWLAEAGFDPDRDADLIVLPPPQTPRRLAAGEIDGFCAGDPWGSAAEAIGAGRIIESSADRWPFHPEKVLAFVGAGREPMIATSAAIIEAGRWLDAPENRDEAVDLLHRRVFPDLPRAVVAATTGRHVFFADNATVPLPAHAAAWAATMRRWGHLPPTATPETAWRPDLWREAATLAGLQGAEATDPHPITFGDAA